MNKLITTTIGTGLNILSHIAPEKSGQLGFNLFCYPLRPKLQEKHKEFLLKASHELIEVNGERIQVYKWGTGNKKLFFAHGWQSHAYRWKAYIEKLDYKEYTIYAVDAPAHGLSSGKEFTVPFYGEVIHKISAKAGKWHAMVGHSLGSFSLMYSICVDEDISTDKLVLLAPPSGASEFVEFYKEMLNLSDRTVRLTVRHFTNKLNNPPEYYAASSFAPGLQMPGLIIHDENDSETSVTNARHIHSLWPESRLIITTGLGHNLRSYSIVEEVAKFINSTEDVG